MALFGGTDDVLPYVEELLEAAEGQTVTVDALTDTRLNDPVVWHLEDGEQPHHVLVAEDAPLRVNERGSKRTVEPSDRLTVVTVLTDRRILFLVGRDSGDVVHAVDYADVYGFEVERKLLRARLEVTLREERYDAAFSRFVDTAAVADFLARVTERGSDSRAASAEPSNPRDGSDGGDATTRSGFDPAAVERALRTIDDRQFERFVADLWRARGWTAAVTSRAADRGVDVVATREEPFAQKHVVQAKRYGPDNPVGSPEVQQYASLYRQEDGVDAVVVVTTGRFTRQAERTARDLNVKLVDGEDLAETIGTEGRHDLLDAHGAALSGGGDSGSESVEDGSEVDGDGRGPDGDCRAGEETSPDGDSQGRLSVDDRPVIRSEEDDHGRYGSRRGHALVALLSAWWTLGLGNLAYAAWACHHDSHPRPEADDEFVAVPSADWYFGIPAGLAIAVTAAVVSASGFTAVGAAGVFVGWTLLVVSTYVDVRRVRATTDWTPITGWWLLGVAVAPLAVVVVPLYLLKRSLATGALPLGGLSGRRSRE